MNRVNVRRIISNCLKKCRAGRFILKKHSDIKDKHTIIKQVLLQVESKKVILLGDSRYVDLWRKRLEKTGRHVECFLAFDKEECHICNLKTYSFDQVIQLIDEDFCYVIIPCKSIMRIIEKLYDYGVSQDRIVVASKDGGPVFGGKLLDCYDVALGFSRIDDLPGFVVFGKEKIESSHKEQDDSIVRIVTLGGSTTDPYYANFRSWSEYLYIKLCSIGINAVIYCGGICSYTSGQELNKLIKDVLLLNPDLVLSYSGTNDQIGCLREESVDRSPYIRKFHFHCFQEMLKQSREHRLTWYADIYNADKIICGLEDNRTPSEFWVCNQRMMHAICNEFGIIYYGFLQPSPEYGGYIKDGITRYSSVARRDTYKKEIEEWYNDATNRIKEIDYIIDLSEIFSGMSGIYYDECHVFEKGNRIIANHVFRIIISDIRRMNRGDI